MYVWESLDACTAREIEKGDTDPKVYFNYQWLTFAKAVIWIKPPCLQEHHRRILGRMLDVTSLAGLFVACCLNDMLAWKRGLPRRCNRMGGDSPVIDMPDGVGLSTV